MDECSFLALERIYADLASALERMGPVCRMRGDCCRLRESGHRLYATSLEFEYLKARAGFEGGDPGRIEKGSCPFLREERCGVREHRMLGCRIYYCDPAFKQRLAGLYEEFHARVKQAMRERGVPYEYFDFLGRIETELKASPAKAKVRR